MFPAFLIVSVHQLSFQPVNLPKMAQIQQEHNGKIRRNETSQPHQGIALCPEDSRFRLPGKQQPKAM